MNINYIDIRYELETNFMISIFDNNYKFKILKNALMSINDKRFRGYIGYLIQAYNKIASDIAPYMKELINNNQECIYDFWLEFYINSLQSKVFEVEVKYNINLSNLNIFSLYKEEYVKKLKSDILEHWKEVSKNNELELKEERDFIKMFDEIHDYTLIKHKDIFIKRLIKLKDMYRCQSGNHYENYERMIPNEKYCKDNRWNPDGVAFLYLGYDNKLIKNGEINNIQKTCFEEIRFKKGKYATLCKFKGVNYKAKLIDLCIDNDSVEKEEEKLNQLFNNSLTKVLSDKEFILKASNLKNQGRIYELKKWIEKKASSYSDKLYIERYISTLIISDIVDAIFVSVDKIDDPELETYIPFRIFAKYLIKKGYGGIIYKSTRMELIGEKGKNVVLFNKEDATYCTETMEVYHYNDNKYLKVKP